MFCLKANEVNDNGNTPLHFAAQFYQEGKIFTAHKLLQVSLWRVTEGLGWDRWTDGLTCDRQTDV